MNRNLNPDEFGEVNISRDPSSPESHGGVFGWMQEETFAAWEDPLVREGFTREMTNPGRRATAPLSQPHASRYDPGYEEGYDSDFAAFAHDLLPNDPGSASAHYLAHVEHRSQRN